MEDKKVMSICGMCTVRCPIQVDVKDGKAAFVQGNPHAAGVAGSLCARGAAGIALTRDEERPQYPMIRDGERGSGKWRRVSWDEAFTYVADKLTDIQKRHGKESVLFSDRGGPFRDFYRAWLRAIGTPNYNNHDSACARNVQNAALSVFGFGRKGVAYDFKNCKHLVTQTRNIFEAINVAEVNNVLDAREKGCKLTAIDIRASITAGKADSFFMVRPGTDYAFNLGVIHTLITEELYDKDYVEKHFKDFRRAGGLHPALRRRLGRPGMRRGRRGPAHPVSRTGRGRALGHLASRLDDGALRRLVLHDPHHLHHQLAAGRHRGQGRAADHEQAR